MSLIENNPQAWGARAALPSHEAAMWSQRGQAARFLNVLRHLDLRPGDTLLDFGCGTGELARWLPANVTYHAHDWAEGMLDRVRVEHPRAVVWRDLPGHMRFDHVVAVGPFNLADNWTCEQTWETLTALWGHAARMLVVSLYRGDQPGHLTYTAAGLAMFADEQGCQRYLVDATHLPNDVMLVMCR